MSDFLTGYAIEKVTPKITVSSSDTSMGSVSGGNERYYPNSPITLTALASSGCQFKN